MAQVLVRDIETQVVERLKKRAKRNNRSFESEMRNILQHAAGEDMTDILAEVSRVRAMFAGRTFSNSVELLCEDRER